MRLEELGREVKELRRTNEILKLASAFFPTCRAGTPTQVLKDFIDRHRDNFGVEPICKVSQVAPYGYWRHAPLLREPHRGCARACREDV